MVLGCYHYPLISYQLLFILIYFDCCQPNVALAIGLGVDSTPH